jgi:hypothetical protein
MENQTSVVGNVAPVSKPPKAPEIGLFYSLLLTPIAGAIFWSMNWKRLGRPQHRWWTWVTAIVVLILECMGWSHHHICVGYPDVCATEKDYTNRYTFDHSVGVCCNSGYHRSRSGICHAHRYAKCKRGCKRGRKRDCRNFI